MQTIRSHTWLSFFREHLQRARGASPHTVRAYRDTLRLLLVHLADARGCSVADLQPQDLQVEAVADFLAHLESERGNTRPQLPLYQKTSLGVDIEGIPAFPPQNWTVVSAE